jgi:hypothetical protein
MKQILKYLIVVIIIILPLVSCEKVIDIELNNSEPALAIEAVLYKDSVCMVRLARTTNYFSLEAPEVVENASIRISEGQFSEELSYQGNGYYKGNTIIGTEEKIYEIEVLHDSMCYKSNSYMPKPTELLSVYYSKNNTKNPYNPYGETVFRITTSFRDDPDEDNFYLVRFTENDGGLLERYYLLTEYETNSGIMSIDENNVITFVENIFYEGGEVEVKVFSIDEGVHNYFLQLTDVLFWKRKVMPPAPYNPESNFDNDVLGYFAAWSYDSENILLE